MHFYWLDQVYLYLMRDYRITVGLDDAAVRRLRGRLPHGTSRSGAWWRVRACVCVASEEVLRANHVQFHSARFVLQERGFS